MPPHLTSLPRDVFMPILDYLGAPSAKDYAQFDYEFEPDINIYRLAQTCTLLRDVCVPRLYEICTVRTGYKLCRSLHIIRTLIARPDIAKRVRRIIVDATFDAQDYKMSTLVLSAEEVARFHQILGRGLDLITAPAPLFDMLAEDPAEWRKTGEALACVALALSPNITSVILLSKFNRTFGDSGYILGRFKADYFPFLEAILLQNTSSSPTTTFDNAICMLPQAAPKVRRLFGWGIDQLPKTAYPYITQLVLGRSRLSNEEMERLPTAFPGLRRFVYVDGGLQFGQPPEVPDPSVILGALLALRKTLRHVELGGHRPGWKYDIRDFPSRPVRKAANQVSESLARMEVLESLRVSASFIYAAGENRHDPTYPLAQSKLAQFLPTSIRSLYLDYVAQESDSADILAFARAVPRQFPNLAQVTFGTDYSWSSALSKTPLLPLLEAQKIECRVTFDGWDYLSSKSVPQHWQAFYRGELGW